MVRNLWARALPGLKLGQHLSRKGEELRHLAVGVPGNDGPVAVVINAGLGEGQLESVRTNLDALDAGVLLDWHTILVPESLQNLKPAGHTSLGELGFITFVWGCIQFWTSFS